MSIPNATTATKTIAINIRATPAWRAWLAGLAEYRRLNSAVVVDQAVTEYARRHGYPSEPPHR